MGVKTKWYLGVSLKWHQGLLAQPREGINKGSLSTLVIKSRITSNFTEYVSPKIDFHDFIRF